MFYLPASANLADTLLLMIIDGLFRLLLRTILLNDRRVIDDRLLGYVNPIKNGPIVTAIDHSTGFIHRILGDLINVRDDFIDAIGRLLVDVPHVLDIGDISQVGHILIYVRYVLHVAHINDVIHVDRCGRSGPFNDLLQNVRPRLLIHDAPCVGGCIENLRLEKGRSELLNSFKTRV